MGFVFARLDNEASLLAEWFGGGDLLKDSPSQRSKSCRSSGHMSEPLFFVQAVINASISDIFKRTVSMEKSWDA